MSEANGTLIKVRNHIRDRNIKLWLDPYYNKENGIIESELEKLAKEISLFISINYEDCLRVLKELQDTALQKLKNQKIFQESGYATFTVRTISNDLNNLGTFDIKCDLNALGSELQSLIAQHLKLLHAQQVKCIIAGKIVNTMLTLNSQGIKNNQNIMVIISEMVDETNNEQNVHDRIRNIKADVERIVNSKRQLFQMEDQDGRPVYVPPEENRSLLMALGFGEKARMALKGKKYDEALYLLLEADDQFNSCNSNLLKSVDNYALVQLDIVWCYLLLKNVSQLPDAERRLKICESSFERTYGLNMERAKAIKGNISSERASLVRLKILQGVIYFHKNQPNQSFEKFEEAAEGLRALKVNDDAFSQLMEMGFKAHEIRLALRECSNNVDEAINFIQAKRSKKKNNSTTSMNREEGRQHKLMMNAMNEDKNWANPRSLAKLIEMGFEHKYAITALRLAKNDIIVALDMLQNNFGRISEMTPPTQPADSIMLTQLTELGFKRDLCEVALSISENDLEKTLIFLIKAIRNNEELVKIISLADNFKSNCNADLPSTSNRIPQCGFMKKVYDIINHELESLKAYERFNEDIEGSAHDYLDVALAEEEQVLIEYQNLLTR